MLAGLCNSYHQERAQRFTFLTFSRSTCAESSIHVYQDHKRVVFSVIVTYLCVLSHAE